MNPINFSESYLSYLCPYPYFYFLIQTTKSSTWLLDPITADIKNTFPHKGWFPCSWQLCSFDYVPMTYKVAVNKPA